jgi:hypothetical protein
MSTTDKIIFTILLALCFNQAFSQQLTQKQQDKLYLNQPGSAMIQRLKNSFNTTWNKAFINFTNNSTYLMGGMVFSNQSLTIGDYRSNFNYSISDYTTNSFKPGYLAGFRVDGLYREKNHYSFQMSLNKIATANNYKDSKSLSPFLGSFSNFKADDQFLNLTLAMHYKKLLSMRDTSKYQIYFVFGPSWDTRLSKQSDDNLVNKNYTRFLIQGDVGLEFENKNFYTLFLHYKQGITSFTKSPIKNILNCFQLGMMINANDIF